MNWKHHCFFFKLSKRMTKMMQLVAQIQLSDSSLTKHAEGMFIIIMEYSIYRQNFEKMNVSRITRVHCTIHDIFCICFLWSRNSSCVIENTQDIYLISNVYHRSLLYCKCTCWYKKGSLKSTSKDERLNILLNIT